MTVEQMIAERDTRSAALSAALTTALAAANTVKGGTASASVSALADDLATELAAANAVVSDKGGTVMAQNLSRLPMAITSIPQGGSVTVEPLSVTENGTYTADQGKAYSPVTVNVPTAASPNIIFYTPTSAQQQVTLTHGLGYAPTVAAMLSLDASSPTDNAAKAISGATTANGSAAREYGFNADGSTNYYNTGFNLSQSSSSSVSFVFIMPLHANTEYCFIIA